MDYKVAGKIQSLGRRWADGYIYSVGAAEYSSDELSDLLGTAEWIVGDVVLVDSQGNYTLEFAGWDDDEYEEEGAPTQYPPQESNEWVIYQVDQDAGVAKKKRSFQGLPEEVEAQVTRYLNKVPMQFLPTYWVRNPDGTFESASVMSIEEEW